MGELLSFGQWLRQRRRTLDLTQEELARRAGCAPITIRKLEADESRPSKQLAKVLAEQLGIPAAEHDAFVRFARTQLQAPPIGQPTVPTDSAPWRTYRTQQAESPVHDNLPIQLTSFIGRERELADLERLLARSRLVTMTGAGGSGKTRLASEVAMRVRELFPDGVWFVDLAPLSDPALLPQTIATVLGVREERQRGPAEALADYLRDKKLLLLLDNCEHLISACANIADTLLHACSNLRILATSREPLNIAGENTFLTPTLQIPPVSQFAEFENGDQYEAIQLFVERAIAMQPGFFITSANAPAIAQLCRRLDGIPLAIELAAALVNALKIEEIVIRLDDRFHLLTGGSRTGLPRHRTLLATIDWSYGLLSEKERMLLRRLSVFAGGWTVEAAETVCAGDGIAESEILDLLIRLVNKSLIITDSQESPSTETRYRMLETIREYAHEMLLRSNEIEPVSQRHLDYYCGFAESQEQFLYSADRQATLEREALEHDNLRAALHSAVQSRSEAALRLAGSLFWFWYHRGYLIEGRRWLDQALEYTAEAPNALSAKALFASGHLAYYSRDLDIARARLEESTRLWRLVGNQRYLAYTLIWLGVTAADQGDSNMACSCHEESVALFRTQSDEWGLAVAILYMGLDEVLGRTEPNDRRSGRMLLEESGRMFRRLGDDWQLGATLYYLGVAARDENDAALAQGRWEEALTLFRQAGDQWRTRSALDALAEIACEQGNLKQAQGLYAESLDLYRKLGAPLTYPLCNLAYVALAQGDLQQALKLYTESLLIALQRNQTAIIPSLLAGLAGVALANGQVERAARLLAAVQGLVQVIKQSRLERFEQTLYDRNLAAARAQLDEIAFDAAWAEGHALPMEQAIALAIR